MYDSMPIEKLPSDKLPQECCVADRLFMKYMDNTLSKKESEKLLSHTAVCENCKRDLSVYESFFSLDSELQEAPDGFTTSVMLQLEAIPMKKSAEESIIYTAWAVFSVLFGAGILIFLNKDAIITAMSAVPALAAYAEIIAPLSALSDTFFASVSTTLQQAATSATSILTAGTPLIIGVSLLATAVLLFVNRKKILHKE